MIEGLKPYAEYKNMGQDWLGELPAHWGLRRAKYLFREIDERSQTGKEELMSVSHITGVTPRSQKTVNMFLAESNVGYKVCRPNDVVINTLWAWMAALGVAKETGIVSPAYGVYRPLATDCFLPRFSDLLLRTPAYAAEYLRRSTGVNSSRLRLYPEQFLQIPLIYPPPNEQAAIVRYLDAQDHRISHLICHKRRLIELLNEQKQAIIHQAVTCGLDLKVRLKPSGTTWLGDVPEHWEVHRLKHLLAQPLKYGANEGAEQADHEAPRYIRITDIDKSGHLNEETFRSLSEDLAKPYLLQDGDILLARSGATVGKAYLYSEKHGRAAFAGYLIRARFNYRLVLPSYLYAFLQSPAYWTWISSITIQSTIQNVSAEKYANLFLPLPPLSEQEALLKMIASETQAIASATNKARREIELLCEFRIRLISDVVTGKLDVQGVELPEIDEAGTLGDIDTGEEIETEAQELIESEEVADADN